MWQWKANHVGILRSTTPDPEWVSQQRVVVKICRNSDDGAVMGQAEIPLDCALQANGEVLGRRETNVCRTRIRFLLESRTAV